MKIKFLVVGKTTDKQLKNLIEIYTKRANHYLNFDFIELADVKKGRKISTELLKEQEADLILSNISNDDEVILLDENGKQFTSQDFANFIQNKMIYSNKNITFVVGGAYGFATKVYQRANSKISLSLMTFSHQMIRLLFVEQFYRAMTIIKGEPYHHQ